MIKSISGPLVTGLIVLGVVTILVLNMQSGRPTELTPVKPAITTGTNSNASENDKGAVLNTNAERPIGDPIEKNHVRVVAVWLSAVKMDGMESSSANAMDLIHIEADIKATENNPNGFAKDEFIPYLKVAYSIVPAQGGSAIEKGELTPMIASDGLHYGANILMPKAGDYRLVYDVEPPSAGGLGRHSDLSTGVAPWWKPFQATFDWTVEPPAPAVVNAR